VALQGAVAGRVVGHAVLPAFPHDAGPGAAEQHLANVLRHSYWPYYRLSRLLATRPVRARVSELDAAYELGWPKPQTVTAGEFKAAGRSGPAPVGERLEDEALSWSPLIAASLSMRCLAWYVPAMARKVYRALGPDVEVVRQQMTLEPPDSGSVTVESDGDQITAVAWTHNGRRCSASPGNYGLALRSSSSSTSESSHTCEASCTPLNVPPAPSGKCRRGHT
jgi:hypothetical protein